MPMPLDLPGASHWGGAGRGEGFRNQLSYSRLSLTFAGLESESEDEDHVAGRHAAATGGKDLHPPQANPPKKIRRLAQNLSPRPHFQLLTPLNLELEGDGSERVE